MRISPKRILVIYYNPVPEEKTRVATMHHLRALECTDAKHDIVYHNLYETAPIFSRPGHPPKELPPELLETNFDAAILHYSFVACRVCRFAFYRWKQQCNWIRDLDCLKIAVPQDEGNFAELLDEWLFELGVSVIFSIHYRPDGPLYPIMRDHATIYPCLPGYIDEASAEKLGKNLLPIAKRAKDIVYRARLLSPRFGKAGRMKSLVAEVVEPHAREMGLKVDISTSYEDVIFGDKWLDFLASGKAVIGCQGGYSALDQRGEVRAEIDAMLRENPSLTLAEIDARMPQGWDDYRLLTMTPRHFQAIVAKTCQILVEGEYKGVLKPNRHYIPLKEDFSNLGEVLEKVRDHPYMQDMVDRAYEEIYLSGRYTYRAFAEDIERAIVEHLPAKEEVVTHTPNPESKSVEKAMDILERQLIAERHHNALLHATMNTPNITTDVVAEAIKLLVRRVIARSKPRLIRAMALALLVAVSVIVYLLLR